MRRERVGRCDTTTRCRVVGVKGVRGTRLGGEEGEGLDASVATRSLELYRQRREDLEDVSAVPDRVKRERKKNKNCQFTSLTPLHRPTRNASPLLSPPVFGTHLLLFPSSSLPPTHTILILPSFSPSPLSLSLLPIPSIRRFVVVRFSVPSFSPSRVDPS